MKPVIFVCPSIPFYGEILTFKDLKIGEEFVMPGDPDEEIWTKCNYRIARKLSPFMVDNFEPDERVARL